MTYRVVTDRPVQGRSVRGPFRDFSEAREVWSRLRRSVPCWLVVVDLIQPLSPGDEEFFAYCPLGKEK